MKIDNVYEKLIKDGYIPEGTLVVHVDDITKLDLTSSEVKQNDANQKPREDKSVIVIDKQGRMQKVSSLLFGYNKQKVQLADGNFAHSDDLLNAIRVSVSKLDKGTVVVDKKGKMLNPEDLLKVVEEVAGKIIIGEKVDKITNQIGRRWSVEGAHSDVQHNKGVVFLGNSGVDLKEGGYVSVNELLKALNEYIVLNKNNIDNNSGPTIPDELSTPGIDNKEIVRVTRKYKNNLSRWLVALSICGVLASGLNIEQELKTINIPIANSEEIVRIIEQDTLNWVVNQKKEDLTVDSISELQKQILSVLKIGDMVQLKDGDILHENSLLTGNKVVIGTGLREAGNYAVSGVSIFANGNVYCCSYVDVNLDNPGFEIGKFINETCEKHGLDPSSVEVRLHIGNQADFTRVGWSDITTLVGNRAFNLEEKTNQMATYDGQVDNFAGATITMDTLNGSVTINVKDADGNLLSPGTAVKGSDGKDYIIGNLDLETTQVEKTDTVIKSGFVEQQVEGRKKLTWRIQDCELAVGLLPLTGAIAASVATKKKNSDSQKNPDLFEFESEKQYLDFKRDFEKAKEEYEKKSDFKKMVKNVFFRKEVDVLQRLNQEQIQQLYSVIKNCHNGYYSYDPSDKIQFVNGKIIVEFKDGRHLDITDVVMSEISSIGKDNSVEAEGLLEHKRR